MRLFSYNGWKIPAYISLIFEEFVRYLTVLDTAVTMGAGAASSFEAAKAMADSAMKQGEFSVAIYFYTQAIVGYQQVNTDAHGLSVLYSNRSCAFDLNSQYDHAYEDGLQAIELTPSWPKAYFRAAIAALSRGHYEDASLHAEKAFGLAPSDSTISALRDTIDAARKSKNIANANKGVLVPNAGSLYAWGIGSSGQLGIGTDATKNSPTVISGLKGKYIHEVACGAMHTCALTAQGEVYSWGDGTYAQLGVDCRSPVLKQSTMSLSPILISKLVGHKIVTISAGAGHTLALDISGVLFGWGMCNQGQLGIGPTTEKFIGEPQEIEAMHGKVVVSIACGIAHSIFLLSSGTIECCGMNTFGQLGFSSSDLDGSKNVTTPRAPQLPTEATGITHIACGGAHTLVIDSSGGCYSCGSNSCGQLGLGSLDDVNVFTRIATFDNFASETLCAFAACGEEFSAVVTRKRSVFTFGLGICGQIGNGALENQSVPTIVSGVEGKGVETLSCSQGQVFAATASGELWAWGLPGDKASVAQFDSSVIMMRPEKVSYFGKKKLARQIACGRKHFVAIVNSPYGPRCSIIKGIFAKLPMSISSADGNNNDDDTGQHKSELSDIPQICAGQKFSFVLETRDGDGELCESGGAYVVTRIEGVDAVDYQARLSRQRQEREGSAVEGGTAERKSLSCGEEGSLVADPAVALDDNMDGTYNGSCRLYISGQYRMSVAVDGLDIEGSPFEVSVKPGRICAAKSYAWWGRFADAESALAAAVEARQTLGADLGPGTAGGGGAQAVARSSSAALSYALGGYGGYGVALKCCSGDAILFTVSARDAWGNKCIETNGDSIEVQVWTGPHVPTAHQLSSASFSGATSGIYPCYFQSPLEAVDYVVRVGVKGVDNDKIQSIQGSPFTLTVSPKIEPTTNEFSASQTIQLDTEPGQVAKTEEYVPVLADPQEEKNEAFVALRRQELTRRRAADALRKEQARQVLEREEQRRRKAVKRTGGGFIIQYSKDV